MMLPHVVIFSSTCGDFLIHILFRSYTLDSQDFTASCVNKDDHRLLVTEHLLDCLIR